MSETIRELRVSNDAISDPVELRRRIADEGYLFFKQLQNPDRLRELRREMMTMIQHVGWLLPDTDPCDGIADISKQCTEGDQEYTDGYKEVYKLEAFHRAAHWPEVTTMIEKIMGRPIMPHPHQIARIWFPKYTEHTTPTHPGLRPLSRKLRDADQLGADRRLPHRTGRAGRHSGSHRLNRLLDHHFSLGAGGLAVDVDSEEEIEPTWHSTDYEAGDTLIFPALMIHRALPNYTRRQNAALAGQPLSGGGRPDRRAHARSARAQRLAWDEVYAGWQADEYQYYWKNYDNPVVARDTSYGERGFAEALELAREGHEQAVIRLRRTIRNDPDSQAAQEAREVFAAVGVPT